MAYFKHLAELVFIANQNVTKVETKLKHFSNDQPQVLAIYLVIKNRKKAFNNDTEIEKLLNITPPTFRKYADILIDCLRKMMVQFEPEKTDMIAGEVAYSECVFSLGLMDFLQRRSASIAANEIAIEVLRKAKNYQFPQFAFRALENHANFMAANVGDVKLLKSLHDDLLKYKNYADIEFDINFDSRMFQVLYSKKKGIEKGNISLFKNIVDKYRPFVNQIESILFHITFFQLERIYHQTCCEHEKVLEGIENAKKYLLSLKYDTKNSWAVQFYHEAATCIILQRLEQAEAAIQKAIPKTVDGTNSWYNAQEVATYIYLHKRDYKTAFEHYKIAVKHEQFQTVRATVHDMWKLLGAHLWLLVRCGRFKISFEDQAWFKFDTSVFVTEEYAFSQDKTGMNITNLMLQLVFSYLDRDWNVFAARAESLRKYAERNLLESTFDRSRVAIKALASIGTVYLEPKKVKEIAEEAIQKMTSMPIQVFSQHHELEMIPYHHFLEILMEN